MSILVAIAVNGDGYCEVLGAAEGMKEDKENKEAVYLSETICFCLERWLLCIS